VVNSCYFLTSPNLYVALSRSSGWETIRLLREFDDEIFLEAHEPELVLEDERLDGLDDVTKLWLQRITENNKLGS
jgi:hypothetical protein